MMMKKIILFIMLVAFVVIGANAQRGKIQTITTDTLTAVETELFATKPIGSDWETLTIQALFTELGGTADGAAILQGSVDGTSYVTIQDYTGKIKGFPNDSAIITNGAVYEWILWEPNFNYYRVAATGTANDTTLVTVKYQYK